MDNRKVIYYGGSLAHHGILGMKWGVRRYQNADGSLTSEGRIRYGVADSSNGANRVSTRTRNRRAKNREKEIGVNMEELSVIKPYLRIDRQALADVKKNGVKSEKFNDNLGVYKVSDMETKRNSDGSYTRQKVVKDRYYLKDNFSDADPTYSESFDTKKEALAAYTDRLKSEIKAYEEAKTHAEQSISILSKASLDEPTFLEAKEAGEKAFSGVMTAGLAATTVATVALAVPTGGASLYLIYPGIIASFVAGAVAGEKAQNKVNKEVKEEYRLDD